MGCAPDQVAAWSNFASALVGLATLVVAAMATKQIKIAANQLAVAAEQLRQSAHGSLLAIEESLAVARHQWKTAGFFRVEQREVWEEHKSTTALARYERACGEEAEAYEQFLNRLDRLCAAVRDGLIPDARAQRDYQQMVEAIVAGNDSLQHKTSSKHENITHIYLKWRNQGDHPAGVDPRTTDPSATAVGSDP